MNLNNCQHGTAILRYSSGSHTLAGTTSSLIGPTQQAGNHTWYWKSSQPPWISETMDLGEPTTTTSLNQHNPQLPSKHLSLGPQISAHSLAVILYTDGDRYKNHNQEVAEPSPR